MGLCNCWQMGSMWTSDLAPCGGNAAWLTCTDHHRKISVVSPHAELTLQAEVTRN